MIEPVAQMKIDLFNPIERRQHGKGHQTPVSSTEFWAFPDIAEQSFLGQLNEIWRHRTDIIRGRLGHGFLLGCHQQPIPKTLKTLSAMGLLLEREDNRLDWLLNKCQMGQRAIKENFTMQTDRLNGLIALKAVASHRSFRGAALFLGISTSAVSQAIKQLERRLGAALLSRTTRSTRLTEVGEKFLNQAGPALEQILVAMEDVENSASRPSGLLRLNTPRAVYPSPLAPLIASFRAKYPDVSVELFFEDHQSDVVQGGFDAGIRLSDILEKDMVAVKMFGPVRFITAAAPCYLKKRGHPKHPRDLLLHDCIVVRFGNLVLYNRWEFESKGKPFQVQVKESLILNDSLIMKDAASDGAGIIYTTENSIQSELEAGKLEALLKDYSTTSKGFYLYYPQRSQVLPKLRSFIEHIKEHSASKR
jgi:DNA-binding transcriptional LysR family regulator